MSKNFVSQFLCEIWPISLLITRFDIFGIEISIWKRFVYHADGSCIGEKGSQIGS